MVGQGSFPFFLKAWSVTKFQVSHWSFALLPSYASVLQKAAQWKYGGSFFHVDSRMYPWDG